MTELYSGKLKLNGQVIRFGGDTIESCTTLSEMPVGVPTLIPVNSSNDTNDSEETSSESENNTNSGE
jgi:hypothetical protein